MFSFFLKVCDKKKKKGKMCEDLDQIAFGDFFFPKYFWKKKKTGRNIFLEDILS